MGNQTNNQSVLEAYKKALRKNNFEVFIVENHEEASLLFFDQILPNINPGIISWGDSMTMHATGVIERIRKNEAYAIIDTFDKTISREDQIERRRQALQSDLFITGTNAVTEKGQLVNLDMIGNRVTGITFGPKDVVLFIGKNKFVKNLDDAMTRIRTISAPLNMKRHPLFKAPCQVTGTCHDCCSPQRICNTWTITEKSYPKGRIKIILINEDLGL
ncbi:MAG: lactate utilization protein [Bacteroidota bacterium]|nr:lactate utilization protein [Bacteroidota bacterium]